MDPWILSGPWIGEEMQSFLPQEESCDIPNGFLAFLVTTLSAMKPEIKER